MHPNVHSSTIYNSQVLRKQPKCPSVDEWVKNCGTFTQWDTTQQKKEFLPFVTAWMELETVTLSEISQTVKDKYHMISLIRGI